MKTQSKLKPNSHFPELTRRRFLTQTAKGATLGVPERVQIEIPTDRDSPEQSFDLLELPDLGQLRVRLKQLATEVLESGD